MYGENKKIKTKILKVHRKLMEQREAFAKKYIFKESTF